MTEKEQNLQLELFSNAKEPDGQKAMHSSMLASLWNYEKTILIIIGIAVIGIISFSFGVERGRRVSVPLAGESVPTVNSGTPSTTAAAVLKAPTVPDNAITIKKEDVPKKQDSIKERQGYVIQLASYKTKALAQKEAETLKKRGLYPLVMSKGSFTVLCVGNIANKEAAQSLLTELKKRFRDCYIRRL